MKALNLLAFDMGASNGRGVLGCFDGNKVTLSELNRFENRYVQIRDNAYWNVLGMFDYMKEAFDFFRKLNIGDLNAFGVDTWGVDYGLLDKNGCLLSNPRSYRMALDRDVHAVDSIYTSKDLYFKTGIVPLNFNTVYQLYRRKTELDVSLQVADTMLLLPDLLGYFFTGEKACEYTNVTTTMLYDGQNHNWDWEIIHKLGLPENIFPQIDIAGNLRGRMSKSIAEELGINQVPFAAVGTHDTASAVACVPGYGNYAFCSSGTWSLFGIESETALISNQAYDARLTNEGTVQQEFRCLKNIMGLWIIQECKREWYSQGISLSWDDIVLAAENTAPYISIIDPDEARFFTGGNMIEKIQRYCRETAQVVPETVGEIARCVYQSLALKYRWTMQNLEEISGVPLDVLHIVGGGSKNKLLNQMVANVIDRTVIAGPVEGAALGNILMQAVALGEISGIDQIREVVVHSERVVEYLPKHEAADDDAYSKLLKLLAMSKK